MSFTDTIKSVSGLTHYYPLTSDANDVVGSVNGTGSGVTYGSKGAVFNGKAYVDLGDHNDFSVATKGALSIVVFLTITNWKGAGASEYIHWMGKGQSAHTSGRSVTTWRAARERPRLARVVSRSTTSTRPAAGCRVIRPGRHGLERAHVGRDLQHVDRVAVEGRKAA